MTKATSKGKIPDDVIISMISSGLKRKAEIVRSLRKEGNSFSTNEVFRKMTYFSSDHVHLKSFTAIC